VSDQLPARSGDLRAGFIEILHLEADMVQAGASGLQELPQMRLRTEWTNDLEAYITVALEIVRGDVLVVDLLEAGGLDAEKSKRALSGVKLGRGL
jgi:hypothetical protein